MGGMLITFEGIDFSGKSVQARLLQEKLVQQKYSVLLLREPGGTTISEKIRDVLLDTDHAEMYAKTELLLYAAARAQMVQERILPFLKDGGIVICDRYFDSTTAYQGYGRQIDLEFINKLHIFVTQGVNPDLTFLFDLDPQNTSERKKLSNVRMDRLDKENVDFQMRVRKGYLKIAQAEPQRYVIIDGSQSIAAIQKEIYDHTKSKLNR
ncbi:MAG: dTMP kinase [bacterium]